MERPALFDLVLSRYCSKKRYISAAHAYIRKVGRGHLTPEEIQDIYQQAILVALTTPAAWSCTTVVELSKWMWDTLKNCTLHTLRSKGRWEFKLDDNFSYLDNSGESSLEDRAYGLCPEATYNPTEQLDAALTLEALFRQLTEFERLLLYLHYWEALTFGQIAQRLSTTEQSLSECSIRVRHHRILSKLRSAVL
ncbi:MAG: sigma-70 family RNA polymerase sigma factor [Chlorobi bacterium]|nr:sigma-70 family RNA polymerase sigma factor [Chlorobiota bacterium]